MTFYSQRSIPEQVCDEAINLIFPGLNDLKKREQLISFIKGKFEYLHCCILCKFSQDFVSLCTRLNLDPCEKEVIIREDYSVHYTGHFHFAPIRRISHYT